MAKQLQSLPTHAFSRLNQKEFVYIFTYSYLYPVTRTFNSSSLESNSELTLPELATFLETTLSEKQDTIDISKYSMDAILDNVLERMKKVLEALFQASHQSSSKMQADLHMMNFLASVAQSTDEIASSQHIVLAEQVIQLQNTLRIPQVQPSIKEIQTDSEVTTSIYLPTNELDDVIEILTRQRQREAFET